MSASSDGLEALRAQLKKSGKERSDSAKQHVRCAKLAAALAALPRTPTRRLKFNGAEQLEDDHPDEEQVTQARTLCRSSLDVLKRTSMSVKSCEEDSVQEQDKA